MKAASLWREAARNVASGTTRAALWALLLAVVAAGLAIADIAQIASISRQARAFQAAGGSVSVLSTTRAVDPVACDALAEVPGVRAAGAVRYEVGKMTATLLPSAPIPLATVSVGFARVLGVEPDTSGGALISDQVAESLGVRAGQSIDTDAGPVHVAGVFSYPNDGRKPGLGYLAGMPAIGGGGRGFDECWVDIWPTDEATRDLLYTTLIPGAVSSDSPPTLGQLNATLGSGFDAAGAFQGRLTRWAPAVGAALGALFGFVAIRIRRLEIAFQLHAGVARSDLRTILGIETLAWVSAAAVIAVAVCLGAVSVVMGHDALGEGFIPALQVLFSVVGAAVGGALVAWLVTREEHLFRYFKNR